MSANTPPSRPPPSLKVSHIVFEVIIVMFGVAVTGYFAGGILLAAIATLVSFVLIAIINLVLLQEEISGQRTDFEKALGERQDGIVKKQNEITQSVGKFVQDQSWGGIVVDGSAVVPLFEEVKNGLGSKTDCYLTWYGNYGALTDIDQYFEDERALLIARAKSPNRLHIRRIIGVASSDATSTLTTSVVRQHRSTMAPAMRHDLSDVTGPLYDYVEEAGPRRTRFDMAYAVSAPAGGEEVHRAVVVFLGTDDRPRVAIYFDGLRDPPSRRTMNEVAQRIGRDLVKYFDYLKEDAD